MHDTPFSAESLASWLAEAWKHTAAVRAVEVDGTIVRYRAWNPTDVEKPGLVLVHGFIAHARWWDHIAPHLTDRYRVIAPDFTGMGDSDRRSSYSRLQYARELVAVAQDAGFDRVILVAHSFGAGCALYAAQMAPQRVKRVIAIDGRVFRRDPPDPDRVAAIRPETSYTSLEDARSRYRLTPAGGEPIAAIVDHIARHSIRKTEDGRWGWKFDPETFRSTRDEDLGSFLRGVSVPTDFIYAANSEVVSRRDLARFLTHVPSCGNPVTIPRSHHHIMIDEPVALIAALNALLAYPRGS